MLFTKAKIGVAVLLALTAISTADARPPLKKEWQGRWDADPFAGTTSIEVKHRADDGPGRTDVIEDPKTVAALMKRLVIQGFQNNIAQGNIPATWLTFRKKDGKSFAVTLDSQGTFQCFMGEIHVDPAFLAALNQQLAGADGQPTDLTKFLPAAPRKKPAPPPPQTLDMLQGGFQSFRVQTYSRGRMPCEGTITDRKALDELAKSITVIDRVEKQTGPTRAQFTIIPKGKAGRKSLIGYVLDREHLFVPDIGTLTIKPSFVKTLNQHLSQLRRCPVDILGESKPTEEQRERERAFHKLFKGVRSLRCIEKGKQDIVVDGREEVEKSLEALKRAETPVRKYKAEATDAVIEVAPARGEKIRVLFLRLKESVEVQPLVADLVEVPGFGQMWLDANWKLSFRFLAERREMEAREQRQIETIRLVSADLPAFLKQVVSLVVTYQEKDEQLMEFLNADTSRPVLEALQVEKVEELSWTPQRWQQEMSKLQEQGSGTIELNPGVGFSLPLIFAGEKELLIPMYGRVRLKADITAKVRQALRNNPDKARALKLLPHGPE